MFSLFFRTILVFGLVIQASHAASVKVSLFSSECLLEGPMDAEALKRIHAIGPAQVFPIQNQKSANLAMETLSRVGEIPVDFSDYHLKMKKHVTALKAFYDALEELKKSKKSDLFKPEPLSKLAGQFILKPDSKNQEDLLLAYLQTVEQNPERLFQATLSRLKIKYHCDFEDEEVVNEN